MKANELLRLMIGDILMAYHDDGETQSSFPVKVDGLDENYTLVDGECLISWKPMLSKDSDEEYADELNPIPLTAEILEKNGWWYDIEDMWQHDEVDFSIEKWNGRFQCYNINQIKLYSVHQLQHILRLCGLNELADNFKV